MIFLGVSLITLSAASLELNSRFHANSSQDDDGLLVHLETADIIGLGVSEPTS